MTITDDLPRASDIYALYESLGWNAFLNITQDELLEAMKNSWYSLYVYEEDKLIATARVVSDGVINAYFLGLGVHPDFRKRGIATELTSRLRERCLSRGLHIQFFAEDQLVPFYEARGFSRFASGMRSK